MRGRTGSNRSPRRGRVSREGPRKMRRCGRTVLANPWITPAGAGQLGAVLADRVTPAEAGTHRPLCDSGSRGWPLPHLSPVWGPTFQSAGWETWNLETVGYGSPGTHFITDW